MSIRASSLALRSYPISGWFHGSRSYLKLFLRSGACILELCGISLRVNSFPRSPLSTQPDEDNRLSSNIFLTASNVGQAQPYMPIHPCLRLIQFLEASCRRSPRAIKALLESSFSDALLCMYCARFASRSITTRWGCGMQSLREVSQSYHSLLDILLSQPHSYLSGRRSVIALQRLASSDHARSPHPERHLVWRDMDPQLVSKRLDFIWANFESLVDIDICRLVPYERHTTSDLIDICIDLLEFTR